MILYSFLIVFPSPISGLHASKCRVLNKLSNELRHAINSDLVDLKFRLCANGLISLDAREAGNADRMVWEVQSRLQADEGVWERVIEVLRDSGNMGAMCRLLEQQLSVEVEEEAARVYMYR